MSAKTLRGLAGIVAALGYSTATRKSGASVVYKAEATDRLLANTLESESTFHAERIRKDPACQGLKDAEIAHESVSAAMNDILEADGDMPGHEGLGKAVRANGGFESEGSAGMSIILIRRLKAFWKSETVIVDGKDVRVAFSPSDFPVPNGDGKTYKNLLQDVIRNFGGKYGETFSPVAALAKRPTAVSPSWGSPEDLAAVFDDLTTELHNLADMLNKDYPKDRLVEMANKRATAPVAV